MNDLFNQFASAFGKKEELSPADAFLAKKNKELEERQQAELDSLETEENELLEELEEVKSAMQPSKAFDDVIPDYSSMPQGLKEAQQRNGVRDHGLTGGFEKTDDNKVKFVEKPNGTVYVNDPNKITPQIKSVIDRKFPDADYVGTGDKVLYRAGIDPVSTNEQADLFEKQPEATTELNLLDLSKIYDSNVVQLHDGKIPLICANPNQESPKEVLDRFNERGIMYPPQGVDKIYIAIDPGKSGGISAVDTNGNVIFKKEMPLLNDELDAVELYSILSDAMSNYNCVLVVEDVHSIFGVSASNNFVFGWVCGQIDAVVKLSKIKHEYIQPKFWQKNCWTNSDMIYKPLKEGQKRASVDTKATSLITAMRLFPREDLRGHVEIKYYGDTKENRKLNRAGEPIPTKKNKPHDGIVDSLLMAEVARRLNL